MINVRSFPVTACDFSFLVSKEIGSFRNPPEADIRNPEKCGLLDTGSRPGRVRYDILFKSL